MFGTSVLPRLAWPQDEPLLPQNRAAEDVGGLVAANEEGWMLQPPHSVGAPGPEGEGKVLWQW